MSDLGSANAALVHDWLPVYAGAERVLEQMIGVLPNADLFSLIDFLPDDQRGFLNGKTVNTSFIQRLPFAKKRYRFYLPFTPVAIEQFDLSQYEIVVSSNYVVAKGVLTTPDQLHVSYVHSPIRYAWDLHFEYLREGGFDRGLRSIVARWILHYMRMYDTLSANRVDAFLANSRHVARRIWKTYRREATVVYPPVDTDRFQLERNKDDFFLTVSRLVPYKRIGLIVDAFAEMPDKKLVVIGDGPEFDDIKSRATENVEMLVYQSGEVVSDMMRRAQSFVFAAEEDFGIVPVEAQACGTPVIAYGKGGATETVVHGETGILFEKQTTESIKEAVNLLRENTRKFDPAAIRAHSEQFSIENFRSAFMLALEAEYRSFKQQ
ncbi:MAG: glycosyltransferase family 4 protein [Rhodothermales bacterium]|nr:glycosyltransferase family 4 protein [Rhodothermales bacterium]